MAALCAVVLGAGPVAASAPDLQGLADARAVMRAADLHAAQVFAAGDRDPARTLLLSPLSLGSALALIAQGADGPTRTALPEALYWTQGGVTPELALLGYRALFTQLDVERAGLELSVANALFAAPDFPFTPAYRALATDMFGAEVATLPFGDPSAVTAVNDWVSRETRGRIPALPLEISAQTQVVVLNALFFKGAWAEVFDPAQTSEGPFTTGAGESRTVAFMRREGRMPYLDTAMFSAVALPYAEARFDFVAALPKPGMEADLVAALTAQGWLATFDSVLFEERQGTLALPRLALSASLDLSSLLAETGLAPLFAETADFGRMSAVKTRITQVVQEVRLDVTEEGSEAAAATGATGSRGVDPNEPFALAFDRPFYLMIRDKQTGAILVMGHVAAP